MLATSTVEGTNVVTATYAGSLSGEQMVRLRDLLTEVVAEHGSARLLVELDDIELGGIEPSALWEDLKLLGMVDRIDRYAMVADQQWVDNLANAGSTITPFDLRVFSSDRRDEAVAWVSR